MPTDTDKVKTDFIASYAYPQRKPLTLPEIRWERWYPVAIFVTGILFGLVVLGWWLWPVRWTNAGYQHLRLLEQQQVVEVAADLFSYDLNTSRVAEVFADWPDAWQEACHLARMKQNEGERIRLLTLAYLLNEDGCNGENATR